MKTTLAHCLLVCTNLLLLMPTITVGFGRTGIVSEGVSETPDFSRHIAPILFEKCGACHRPDGAAPFSLLTWQDARKRARQIAEVTRSRYMPPWLPEPGHLAFENNRRLNSEEIRLLKKWAETGTLRGDPSKAPPMPEWSSDWQLGEPDLTLEMKEEYSLKEEGGDVIRYFTLVNPLKKSRFVRGFEFQPGNGRIVHHARMLIDTTGLSKRLDDQDPAPGFSEGMGRVNVSDPDGHWLGWTPGKQPILRDPKFSWRLKPGTAVVLELHLVPTGKPEKIQSSLGLYFTDQEPTRQPVILRIGSVAMDIPADSTDYVVLDEYRLPTDVELLNVYPHAHLLARRMQAWATFPNGRRETLLEIKRWNFDWQDEYRYLEPYFLPKGTILSMRYEYDNSSSNPRNPFQPPRRIIWGEQTENEMGDLWFQVVTSNKDERVVLNRDFHAKETKAWDENYRFQLEFGRNKDNAHFNFGSGLVAKGEISEAIFHFKEAIKINPSHAEAHYNLASAYQEIGNQGRASIHFSRAIDSNPEFGLAYGRLGTILANRGDWATAIARFKKSLDLLPRDPLTRNNLGVALLSEGRLSEAERQFKWALEIEEFADPHYNLGTLYGSRRQWGLAELHLRRAISIRPVFTLAVNDLGNVFAEQARWEEAADQFARALEIDPGFVPAREALRQVQSILRHQQE